MSRPEPRGRGPMAGKGTWPPPGGARAESGRRHQRLRAGPISASGHRAGQWEAEGKGPWLQGQTAQTSGNGGGSCRHPLRPPWAGEACAGMDGQTAGISARRNEGLAPRSGRPAGPLTASPGASVHGPAPGLGTSEVSPAPRAWHITAVNPCAPQGMWASGQQGRATPAPGWGLTPSAGLRQRRVGASHPGSFGALRPECAWSPEPHAGARERLGGQEPAPGGERPLHAVRAQRDRSWGQTRAPSGAFAFHPLCRLGPPAQSDVSCRM